MRLLRPGGKGLIYAWAKEQSRSESGRSSYLKREQQENRSAFNDKMAKCKTDFDLVLPVHENKTDFRHADLLVPWKRKTEDGDKVFHRFYHVYHEGELESAVSLAVGDLAEVLESYYDQGNWCVVIRKKF